MDKAQKTKTEFCSL